MSENSKMQTIGVLTSGGDAQGMNACIRAVTRYALNNGIKVKGILRGYSGLLEDDIIDLDAVSVGNIIHRGGTILYTARCLEFIDPDPKKAEAAIAHAADNAKKAGIQGLVVIGGDGSWKGAQKLSKHGLNVIGIPGTIDRDVACSDYTIGFDSAVSIALEAIIRLRDTSSSHERCSVIEVMGRKCGEIALWAGLTGGADAILIPERPETANFENILKVIQANRARGKKDNIIVVAEGVGGTVELAKRIQEETGIESRATILGHVQRGGIPTATDIMHASRMGVYAVKKLMQGANNRVVAFKDGKYCDFDIDEALAMERKPSIEIEEENEMISTY
ncbi:MAG TPA: ATP-dependent 6-phosphofructokinase [Lachnospiraceae bacterium]|nr:ATP-dependent 6-phosphofructokinase [Lachnospiraceae bacterium]